MKVLFISGIYNCKIGGLYNSIINRLIRLKSIDSNIELEGCNIVEIDSYAVRAIKRLTKTDINIKVNSNNDKFFKQIVYIRNNMFNLILKGLFPTLYINNIIQKVEGKLNIKEYDIIHCHWLYPHGFAAYKLALKYDKKLIVTGHGSDVHSIYRKSSFIRNSIKEELEYADYITLVSEGLKEKLIDIYNINSSKILVIGNGVDINLFKLKTKEENNLKTYKTVGYVGNLNYTKGSDRLPRIFELISKELKSIRFVIVGDGELKHDISSNFNNLGLEVDFVGRVAPELVPDYINKMDVMILPSRNEGFGMVIIEANSCGVPCVAAEVGGIPEVISDKRLLIPVNNNLEERFAEKVIDVLKSPIKVEELLDNAKRYDWKEIIKKEVQIYKKVSDKR
ncbi:glycosyltransferase family 4 protein [Clostridium sp. C8-1-8]|uniref:glycosyltransferase family 4 protein n=1 Tax=Clostridium sp. C8-1-8 TaxID=2698831 RepID=UPI001367B144|nr:glycosyltransferase family 4 protein [Clostridium sp. C8-1-8]